MKTLLALMMTLAASVAHAEPRFLGSFWPVQITDYYALEPILWIETPRVRIERIYDEPPICPGGCASFELRRGDPQADLLFSDLTDGVITPVTIGWGSASLPLSDLSLAREQDPSIRPGATPWTIGRMEWFIPYAERFEDYSVLYGEWRVYEVPEPAAIALCLPALAWPWRRCT